MCIRIFCMTHDHGFPHLPSPSPHGKCYIPAVFATPGPLKDLKKMEGLGPWLLNLVSLIVGAVLGNRLTYSRSTKEKLWDLRRQSYGVILSELAAADRIIRGANEYIAS